MKLDWHGRSEVGHVRERNEDAYAAGQPDADPRVFAVADGMGGHPGGDQASRLAVDVVLQAPPIQRRESIREYLARLHHDAAISLQEFSRAHVEFKDMGTTFTLAAFSRGLCYLCHVGDTRLYWIRSGERLRVTRDHTLAQEMVESGRLLPEEAEDHPMSNVLTRCLGVCPDQRADLPERGLVVEAGDRFILASDGLVKAVATADLAALIADRSAQQAADALVQAALAGGAPDNVTVIVVEIVDPDAGTRASEGISFADVREYPWAAH
ncbi:MAG: serine/threonine-protein phosphatase [Candidatus Eisenbacteria bacterium]|nr:serine/threonine-protein phosphatase [Candidatus Eisenbacteria bacterium]